MAGRPCDLGPLPVVPLHPEQARVEAEARLEALGGRAGEAPQVAPRPEAGVSTGTMASGQRADVRRLRVG